MVKTKIYKIINQFIESLRDEIPLQQVILFGSSSCGREKLYSDIDLIVVSSYFNGKRHIKNMQYLFRKAAKVNSMIEPIPATPEEIQTADKRGFLGQVIKKGKVIWSCK